MALTYGFFDAELVQGQYDRVYGAAEFAQYFSLLIKNGVFPDPSTNLQVKASSPTANMNVNIEAGYGWINGYWAKNDSPYTLTIQPAHGSLNRIDAVVLRWVSSTRSMEFDVLTGTPNASPQVPNLTRTVEIYELMLASITVANGATSIAQASITDKRPDSSVCGWVTSLIENIDTTDLFAQFEDAFETWFDNIKGQLEGDVVTNLERLIDERVKIEDKATYEEAIAGTNDTKWMTPKTTDVAIKQKANKIGDIVTASYDKEIDSNGEFVKCDGRILLYSEYQEFSDKINRVFGTQIYNSNPDVDLNLKNIETVLSKLYTDSYTYVLHGGSYYYIRKYGTSENTEPNYITTTDRLDTKEATNFVSPMFMDDSLNIDPSVLNTTMDDQMNLFSMEHENKYGELMNELIEIFIPPEGATGEELENAKRDMQKYSDYRTYLSFDMEQIVDGDEKLTIGLSKMIKKNSGGEGQNPLYVALLASFAQAYGIHLSPKVRRNPSIRLVVLDEAFSKMDAEKVASCIDLIRNLGFQAIISATNDKIQNYLENVDKTFVYANPNKKNISIQEFEKCEFDNLVTEE